MSAKHLSSPVRPIPARPSSPPPLNHEPGAAVLSNASAFRPVRTHPSLCSVVLTDVAGSAARDSRGLRRMRDDLYEIMAVVTAENGFDLESLHFDDTGDGLRLIIPTDLLPPSRIVDAFVTGLTAGLREHRRYASELARIRMRVCFDLGFVEAHRHSWTGDPMVRVARLIESRQLRESLDANPDADLAAIVSDAMYEVTRHRAAHIPLEQFQEIRVRVKEFDSHAWLLAPLAITTCTKCAYPLCLAQGAA